MIFTHLSTNTKPDVARCLDNLPLKTVALLPGLYDRPGKLDMFKALCKMDFLMVTIYPIQSSLFSRC